MAVTIITCIYTHICTSGGLSTDSLEAILFDDYTNVHMHKQINNHSIRDLLNIYVYIEIKYVYSMFNIVTDIEFTTGFCYTTLSMIVHKQFVVRMLTLAVFLRFFFIGMGGGASDVITINLLES